ncbi:MAG: hypothetical protein P8I04_01470 [Algibacter sp.]|uniref:hypothetical protein n=1 Tax=Algibacter sp. TaxID=1872428 RepID=UPI002637AB79|nr:hypothetical protein [Algibacter sp.]MDG1728527.1 hypothetical protein [Algibacter sp.]
MTTFITEFFKLDLSHLNIKFSEENSFFEKDLIKQQSFPFKVPKERSFMPFFEFISSHNSVESNKYIKGTLFRNDKYYQAELLVLGISKQIEVVLYYSFQKLTIFDKNLHCLPWETLDIGESIHSYAEQIVVKDYPDTVINFPSIYTPELYKDYDFGQYIGFINHNEDGGFSENLANPYNLPFSFYKMNEMRPLIYLKEVVKFIFSQIGYNVTGDFITNSSIAKCLLYHENSIFYTNKDYLFSANLNLTLSQSNVSGYTPSNLTYNEYTKSTTISSYGSYKVNLNMEGEIPAYNGGSVYIRCYFNGEILSTAGVNSSTDNTVVSFDRNLEFSFDVPKNLTGSLLEIKVICVASVKNSIVGEYEIKGTIRPLYKDYISLQDLLPDITVGELINSVKESFNMTAIFDQATQTVQFNFFNSFINSQPALDLSKYTIESTPRKLNKSIGYKIPFSDGEILNLNKSGDFVTDDTGFTEKRIPLEPLPVIYIDAQANVKHQEGLSMLFFESNVDAKPLVVDGDIAYSRIGFVHTFLRNWLFQNLNSEEYSMNIQLPLFISSKLNSESKIWFYNNYFLVHNLKRLNVNSLFEKFSLRLFKLKNYPTFNLVIDDGSGTGGTTFDPPIAITTPFSNSSGTFTHTNQFNATIYGSAIGGPSYFTIDIFANGSSDPQGLTLSFGWEVISSPDGNASGIFQAQNSDHSITRFTNSSYINLAGNYTIRLTVVNSQGLSDTVDVTVTAS